MFKSAETRAWKPKLKWPKEARHQWGKASDLGGKPREDDYFVEVFMKGKQYIHARGNSFDECESKIHEAAKIEWVCQHSHWRRRGLNGHQNCVGCGMSNLRAGEIKRIGMHRNPLNVGELGSIFMGSHLRPDDEHMPRMQKYYRMIFLRARLNGLPVPDGVEDGMQGYNWGQLRKMCSQLILDLLEQNGGMTALRSPDLIWEGRVVADCSHWSYEKAGEALELAYAAWEYSGKPRLSEQAPPPVMTPYSFQNYG